MWSLVAAVLVLVAPSATDSPITTPVGYAIDVFERYGQMVFLFKVLPLNVEEEMVPPSGSQLYRGSAARIFRPPTVPTETKLLGGQFSTRPRYDFCRGYHQLMLALFSDWKIEGTEQPYKALIASTPRRWIAERLGINAMYLNDTFYYVLVRLERPVIQVSMLGEPSLAARVKRYLGQSNVNLAAQTIMVRFGTHYVRQFRTGDFVYQLYVYNPGTAVNLDQLFDAYESDPATLDGTSQLFSPWYASHIGQVVLASAPQSFAEVVGDHLSTRVWFRRYQSIFLLLQHEELMAATQRMSQIMVIGAHLRSVEHLISVQPLRQRLSEVITNRFLLWDNNM